MRIMQNRWTFVLIATSLCATRMGALDQRTTQELTSLPTTAQFTISAALGKDLPENKVQQQDGTLTIENDANRFHVAFTQRGVEVRSGNRLWHLRLLGYGYEGSLCALSESTPERNANRVQYRRGALTEWYVNGPLGLEQGFTIQEAPGNGKGKPLSISLSQTGDLMAAPTFNRTEMNLRDRQGNTVLQYGGLSARDATGKELPAWLESRGREILLRVKDEGAHYPVVIDPIVQKAKLTASDGQTGDEFGLSVAISGNTIVVGSLTPARVGSGAAYVFAKPSSGWTNMMQTAKLTASDAAQGDEFGYSVAVEGNTIVVGAPGAKRSGNESQGAVYAFLKPAAGWHDMKQTAELNITGATALAALGQSVAIAGNTIVAGAPYFGTFLNGTTYVFVKPHGGWKDGTQTAALTTSSDSYGADELGHTVAISSDAAAIVAGAPCSTPDGLCEGAAYVFVKPASGWTDATETAKLTASVALANSCLGNVSMTANTIVAGAPEGPGTGSGAIYVYVRPDTGWQTTTETAKLTVAGAKETDSLGIAVSNNDDLVVASARLYRGGRGAVYVYVRPASGWQSTSHFNARLFVGGTPDDFFGTSIGMAGHTLVVGDPQTGFLNQNGPGLAYVFEAQ